MGKKQSHHPWLLPPASSIPRQSSRSANQLLGGRHGWEPRAGTRARDCGKSRCLMFALFIYLAATFSARVPFCGGAISRSRLLLAHPCWLRFLPGAISLACTKKPPRTSLPGCPPCPACETPPACHGNSRPSCQAQQSPSVQARRERDKGWLQRCPRNPQDRDAAPALNPHCPSHSWAGYGMVRYAI